MATPFPTAAGAPFESSVDWISDMLLGSVAIGICVLAVAAIGLMMLTGRLPVRKGMRVVLGCFVLLGAPVIAAAFSTGWSSLPEPAPVVITPERIERPDPRADLPPAQYDPYAGASLRSD